MSTNLIAAIERSLKSRSGGGKKKSRRKSSKKRRVSKRKPKIVFRTRTRTIVKVRRVHVKGHTARRKTSKKRRTKKGGKLKFGSPAWRKKYMKKGRGR